MTSVLAGGVETINVLDGRLSISGPPDSIEPTIVGDPAAMVEMTETAEIKLLPELRGALSEQGFDDELHTPVRENAYSYQGWTGYWWGFPVTVKNLQAWVDWDGRICGPSEIGAVAY